MHCLFLDLASHNGLIACTDAERTVAVHAVSHRIGDHELLPIIEHTLEKAGWSYGDLSTVACVIGPGGFTSLRVGVTCANVLAHELKVPLGAVHLREIYGVRAIDEDAVWMHSTKKDQLFVCGGPWKEPTLVNIEELRAQSSALSDAWMGELIPEHRTVIDGFGMKEAALRPLEDALPALISHVTFGNAALEPWYGRGW